MSKIVAGLTGLVAFVALTIGDLVAEESAGKLPAVDFNRDIRPILSDNCFTCHGPDEQKREAELRLDLKAGAFADRDGSRAIVPKDLKRSSLFQRITSADADERMPPADFGKKLTGEQIALIRRWIEQGADWQDHWSFVAPKRHDLPATKMTSWCRNPIDHFVLARLEREGLQPSPEADKATLIRRVTLDLTGLPPTPKEVDAFLKDDSPQAYERLLDRLLKSPRYGERMATVWLDLARYADTSGYQNDGPRYMWRWRDWVIDAYNKNMPFDQFTIQQIAGDMLVPAKAKKGIGEVGPRAPLIRDEKHLNLLVASAFNRNHRGNAEGGIIPEEYQVEYVVDRVDTTFTTWLGLTMGCARCHDHKYDPISQKEFYQVFAYFNNVPEYGRAIKEGNSPPYIKAPTREQLREIERLEDQKRRAAGPLRIDKRRKALREWEKTLDPAKPIDWTETEGLIAHFPFEDNLRNAIAESTKSKIEAGEGTFAAGKLGRAIELDGKRFVNAGDVAKFGYFDKFTLAAWVFPTGNRTGTIVSRMTMKSRGDGYYIHLEKGKVQVNLVKRWLDDAIRVESKAELAANRWHHVAATYDGSRVAKGITVYINGEPQELKIHYDFLNQTMASDEPLRIGAGHSGFQGKIDDVRVYDRCLPGVSIIATADSINAIAAIPERERTINQHLKLMFYFLRHRAPKTLRQAQREFVSAAREYNALVENLPHVMVMVDSKQPRDTFVLERGEYNKPKEKVTPGVPSIMPPLPKDASNNRLGFARWLVDPSNPLTARVAVNRYWSMYFGQGLVRTLEDFGSQGERPSHPELLDWLATEFVRSGWNVKQMQKMIVTSAAYRQSSRVSRELLEKDRDNRLLARGPRFRLSAEMVRDQALAASGLLYEKIGGPSVKPYQPDGLWTEIATDKEYKLSEGRDIYRRSMYTYWKRTVAPPTMTTFDATPREMCTVKRARTNTPLQALALMNDVTYVEAARVLAARMMTEGGTKPAERIAFGFRLIMARSPNATEQRIFERSLQRKLARFKRDKDSADKLVAIGMSKPPQNVDDGELAAYTAVASLMLNLDEAIMKQ